MVLLFEPGSPLTSITYSYIHLKGIWGLLLLCLSRLILSFVEIFVNFITSRPTYVLEFVIKDDAGVKYKSSKFKKDALVHWNLDMFVHFPVSLLS